MYVHPHHQKARSAVFDPVKGTQGRSFTRHHKTQVKTVFTVMSIFEYLLVRLALGSLI